MSRSVVLSLVFLTVLALVPRVAGAQEGDMFVRVTPTEGQCPTDTYVVGYIGYKDLECNCSFTIAPDGPRRYDFRAEPIIGGVEPGSPADGKLRAGDVIAAIDGHLITTREGGRRFARITPDEPVTLTVRRGGREVDVSLVPQHACYEVAAPPPPRAPSPPERTSVTPRPPRTVSATPSVPRRAVTTPAPPRRPTLLEAEPLRPTTPVPPPPPPPDISSGWVGFSIHCAECRFGEDDGVLVWDFPSPPEVDRVESQSPADKAGIQAGDRLTHINGHSITSTQGGRLFGTVEPGDTVTFRYTRNNSILESEIVAATRIQYRSRLISGWNYYQADTVAPSVTRFSGVIGDAHVLVTGGPVSVNRTDGELVIQAGDITVRVRRTGGTEDSTRH